jgi:hypothetical protein
MIWLPQCHICCTISFVTVVLYLQQMNTKAYEVRNNARNCFGKCIYSKVEYAIQILFYWKVFRDDAVP